MELNLETSYIRNSRPIILGNAGLPKNIEDRKNEEVFDLKLPIPRPKNSIPPLIKKN